MSPIMRLPALPLVANDPYFSVWCAADRLTDADTTHWSGAVKRLCGMIDIDGKPFRYLGLDGGEAMETLSLTVTPTSTRSVLQASGVLLTLVFTTPLLLDDPDVLSTPVTFIELSAEAADGKAHELSLSFSAYDDFCYDGSERPRMAQDVYQDGSLHIAYTGQRRQNLLCHSGDRITIDWGYLYLASRYCTVKSSENALKASIDITLKPDEKTNISLLLGYDDVASIHYFGMPAKAWYARNGKTFGTALKEFDASRDALLARCARFDETLTAEALQKGGEDYALICVAAYRQSIAAHKLIADREGRMVWLSKENDSNGCIGTVDVSYPSAPLFLKYNPEFVRGMCRPVLEFAKMPVWKYDFAPHDVGQYPQASGQVYGTLQRDGFSGKRQKGDLHPAYYLYPADADCYDLADQMPVEECGNLLIMLYAASFFDKRVELSDADIALLEQWVRYLVQYGDDPGEQLCTDDFAGHLAHNVNLSAKAIVGVACYAGLLKTLGDPKSGSYRKQAEAMAAGWHKRASVGAHTALTFDGLGWSMKYNLAWDRVLKLGLFADSFYQQEISSYLSRVNMYGLPLDSRRGVYQIRLDFMDCVHGRSAGSVPAAHCAGSQVFYAKRKPEYPSAIGTTRKPAIIFTLLPEAFRAACLCRYLSHEAR